MLGGIEDRDFVLASGAERIEGEKRAERERKWK